MVGVPAPLTMRADGGLTVHVVKRHVAAVRSIEAKVTVSPSLTVAGAEMLTGYGQGDLPGTVMVFGL
jgi:hypothetical protein